MSCRGCCRTCFPRVRFCIRHPGCFPDSDCPSNPDSYRLFFDVLDEYIEVMRPGMVHIGHDEWRIPVDVCPLCKWKDYRELFVQDVRKIHILVMHAGKRDKNSWPEGKTGKPQNVYGYLADPVECSRDSLDSRLFYAYEWKNPRFGKALQSIHLKGASPSIPSSGKAILENAIVLLAISKVEKRPLQTVKPRGVPAE